jgi:hypothetical protein
MAVITILQVCVLWIKNFNLDVCMHINTYSVNSGISMNFNKEYASVTAPTAHTHLYIYSSHNLFLTLCREIGCINFILLGINVLLWSQRSRILRRGSAATRLLGLQVRISLGAWLSLSCGCCVLSNIGLCMGLITRPEDSYRVWCIWMW